MRYAAFQRSELRQPNDRAGTLMIAISEAMLHDSHFDNVCNH
ncbi:hypothetical protein ACX5DB_002100 [Enterobacter ludwigii]